MGTKSVFQFPSRLALPSLLPENAGRTLIMKMTKNGKEWQDHEAPKAKALQYKVGQHNKRITSISQLKKYVHTRVLYMKPNMRK